MPPVGEKLGCQIDSVVLALQALHSTAYLSHLELYLRAHGVTFRVIYWHEMESKIHTLVYS